ncbi:MAG: carbon starvation protein A [Ruminococcaceae bacterium]|nr:carbon starvation protein A [Oscillospiraceae bacterium]
MNGITIMLISIAVLLLAYIFYGRWIAKKWGIDPKRKTPAYEQRDGVDYEPAPRSVVFGHQFASIAGAGPINGPIQAAIFGWVPVLLWVLIGGVFFGAVQDFTSMYASVRNKGRSIGYIIEKYIGKTGKKMFLLFVWLFCILVVAAFADIVAGTFMGYTVTEGVRGANITSNGAVATTSMMFIVFAIALGLLLKYTKLPAAVNTVIAIAMLVGAVVIGLNFPMYLPLNAWHILVFVYIFIASVVPVWLLLQPRDYLNSYLLVVMILAAVVGVFVANPTINLPAFTSFNVDGNYLFPILFVTIACGAVSGFHSLVSSGTASKQIKNEKDMLPVSFGAMLLESMLAVVALIAVASFATGEASAQGLETPAQIFAGAVAGFLTKMGLPNDVVFTLITLSISAFALTSLDSVARVGRLSFQELFLDDSIKDENIGPVRKVLTNKYFATFITLALAFGLTLVGYKNIWALFGASNQLLSVFAFLACAVFLKRKKKVRWFLYIPLGVMMAVTFTALSMTIFSKAKVLVTATSADIFGDVLQLVFATLIVVLGVCVVIDGVKKLFGKDEEIETEPEKISEKVN